MKTVFANIIVDRRRSSAIRSKNCSFSEWEYNVPLWNWSK